MKQKIKLFVMLWKAINGSKDGWIFFQLNKTQQENLITNNGDVDITIRYVGIDKRVAEKVVRRIVKPSE